MQEEKPKRNYKKEYNRQENYVKKVGVSVSPQLFEDLTVKCDMNGTTKNAVLKNFIERYTYENN